MCGNLLKEKELKALSNGTKIHLYYSHPSPDEPQHDGVAYVTQNDNGCWFHIGGKNSTFCMDYEYSGNDEQHCMVEGDDGDTLEVYEYLKK